MTLLWSKPRIPNFYASGEVKNPSEYPYKEGLTVRQAISMAGGLTEKAQLRTFQVLRRVNNHEETVAVGLDSLVFPDDIIVADADGVIVIPSALVTDVVSAGLEQERLDEWQMEQIKRGVALSALAPMPKDK